MPDKNDDEEVNIFKAFLKIRTAHPSPNYVECVKWLRIMGENLNLSFKIINLVENLPIVILSRLGTEPHLSSIGLNCHVDVVPTLDAKWDKLPQGYDPFSAYEDENGNIISRGAQDMKCCGAQYLCALKRLKKVSLHRTIHTIWVPDEEIGGKDGMKKFVLSKYFKQLNLGCMIDEGLAHNENKFVIYYGERTAIWAKISAVGPEGHGSKFVENSAIDRLMRASNCLTQLRDKNKLKLTSDQNLRLGDVTTINITAINGGVRKDDVTFFPNIVPSSAFIIVDIRVTQEDYLKFVNFLKFITNKYSLDLSFINGLSQKSTYSDVNSHWLNTIVDSLKEWVANKKDEIIIEKSIFPAATDSRFVRNIGIPAFGFSPIRNTPSLLHDHNEYLNRKTFIEGVDIMTNIIKKLSETSYKSKF